MAILFQTNYVGYDCSSYRPPRPEPPEPRPDERQCPSDQFYSSEMNECLECFCFGIKQGDGSETKCQASNLRRSSVSY